jgi:plasmid stabilization system protein ParE
VIRVVFEVAAQADVRAAMAHYSAVSTELATRFATDLDDAVGRIQQLPEAWPPAGAGLRRCLLRHFPYSVIYRTAFDPLRVLAVMHHRQSAGRWQGRL